MNNNILLFLLPLVSGFSPYLPEFFLPFFYGQYPDLQPQVGQKQGEGVEQVGQEEGVGQGLVQEVRSSRCWGHEPGCPKQSRYVSRLINSL